MKLIAIGLIVLGVIALAYGGITYKSDQDTLLEVGDVKVTAEQKKTIPLPPILGVIALVGGIALLISQQRRN
ncbi:MAG TPA: DUF3185 domain-containing protein [Candidatus Eisenbacteria bacterium]|nr:DUF3185 domain-containing protein [Candidatus Eisenbacteria bacterium]